MTCTHCQQRGSPDKTWFCYRCGQPVCGDCVIRVQLPLETTATTCPDCHQQSVQSPAADASMWEITVEAALVGHDLAAWEVTTEGRGWQVGCRLCGKTAWVGASGVMYTLLGDSCLEQ